MCGIIGYIGEKNALPFIMEGLGRESYRGYDSSGIVVFGNNKTHLVKSVGKLETLEKKLAGQLLLGRVGLGHNRWATHGNVTEKNAHPHADCTENIFVVHNGVIENYRTLKELLEKNGHIFTSETDTEVLTHLIEHFFKGNLEKAVQRAVAKVKGAYAIAVIARQDPGKIVAARLSAPLVITAGDAGGFVASDPAAIISHTDEVVFLDDKEIAVIKENSFLVTDMKGRIKKKPSVKLSWTPQQSEKGEYAHFMLKEIMEHAQGLKKTLAGRLMVKEGKVVLDDLENIKSKLEHINSIHIIACGGSFYAALAGAYMLEEYANISVKVDTGSEFRYKKPVFNKKTLYMFISQSGETADTLSALEEARAHGFLTMGIVNVVGSTLSREVSACLYAHSGPEIAVASTKTFTGQLATLALLTLFLGAQRGLSKIFTKKMIEKLSGLPRLVEKIFQRSVEIERVAQKYQQVANMCVIGRSSHYPIALEGALKLKEVAYVHAEAIAGGELKHGYLSLINSDFPTLAIVPSDSVYEKMISSIQQIKARGGSVIAIATEGNEEIKNIADDVIYIPKTLEMLTPILTTVALHLFSYHMAVARGCEIDQPRNLAKSVTVE